MADLQIEQTLQAALRMRKTPGPMATGVCLYCEEYLADGVRWCDGWCRDQWARDQGARPVRAGGAEF